MHLGNPLICHKKGECKMIDKSFWKDKRVFITGHTGFKGAWLSIWLYSLGAKVTGYALNPPTTPSLFDLAKVDTLVHSIIGDIRDREFLKNAISSADPEIVIHMAAQPLVIESYKNPVETYETNVMGTVNLFEGIRSCKSVKAVINVTTDKVYENKEWLWGYRENEPLGGYDPYSSSKACSELVTSSYRNSFFNTNNYIEHGVGVASARAGNVIGGGDWAPDRLIPDCIRSLTNNQRIEIRNPRSIRPWQHVLEPLSGYLLLAQSLFEQGEMYSQSWNFGPDEIDAREVGWIVEKICEKWGGDASFVLETKATYHEATYLKLDCSKSKKLLNWHPTWELEKTIEKIVCWAKAMNNNENLLEVTLNQIYEFQKETV